MGNWSEIGARNSPENGLLLIMLVKILSITVEEFNVNLVGKVICGQLTRN